MREAELVRTLNLRDLALLIIGSVIGSGIFITPGSVLRNVGGAIAPAILVWFAGGALSLLGALTYGELSAMRPAPGGLYVYLKDCFGRLPAFLFGWTLFFVIASGAIATLSVAFSSYLSQIIPLSPLAGKLVSVAMIAAVMAVNVYGTRRSSDLQNWTTAIKVGAIMAMSALLLWSGRELSASAAQIWPREWDWDLASGFGVAMLGALWAYEGWQFSTYSAGEAINPQRDYPKAFAIGVLALVAIYVLANVAYLAALGPGRAAATDSIAAASVESVLGAGAAKLIALAILISIFSAANSVALTTPRVFYAMARDGLFFKRLARVHPRFRTPAFAVVAGSMWAALLAVTGTFEQLLTYVVFVGWGFYGLAAASVFVYRRRRLESDLPYRVPGYPLTPLIFIAAASALVANTVLARPREALIGIGIVLLGLPAYAIWSRRAPES